MSDELKQAVENGLKAVDDKLTAAITKYEGQIADNGKASTEAKAAVAKLAEEFKTVSAQVLELAQKAGPGARSEPEAVTAGEQFVKSDAFKALLGGQMQKARIEVKAAVVSDAATNVAPSYKPGIVPGAFIPLSVRDVLPSAFASSPLVIGIREATFTNAAAETAQGAAKPNTAITFEQYNVPIQTVAHYIKVSNQLMQDAPAVTSYIDTRLRYGLEARIDAQLLNGDGVGANLAGLMKAGNYTAFTPTAGANLAESINKAKYQLWAAGYQADTVIVNPADWGAMETLKSSGSGEYLWGAPGLAIGMNPFGVRVVISANMAAGKFLVGGFRIATTLWQRQGDTVEMGFENDDFTKNLITIRAECRLGLEINRPSALLGGAFTA